MKERGRAGWFSCRFGSIRVAAVMLITAAFLCSGTFTAGAASGTQPWFHFGMPSAHTGGGNWSPNTPVTIQVNTDGIPGPEYTDTVMSDGSGWINSDPVGWQVDFGDEVTVSDGTATKTHIVTYVEIAGFDLVNDTVHGFAAFDTTVQVEAHNNYAGQHSSRMVNSGGDPSGWIADFHVVDEFLNPTVDLAAGTHLDAIALDHDGDGTQVGYDIPSPYFGVSPADDHLWGDDWDPNAEMTITIDDDDLEVSPDYEATTTVDAGGHFDLNTRNEQGVGFDIAPDMSITVTDGTSTKTHEVTFVDITGVDQGSNVVTGTAVPGSTVQVWVNTDGEGPQPTRWVTAGLDGAWSADFATGGEGQGENGTWEIGPGARITAGQWDDDGDHTIDNLHISNPWFGVNPATDDIWGQDWASGPGGHVTITIDDPANGESVDFTMNAPVDQWGAGFGTNAVNSETPFDFTAGMIVRVVNGDRDKSHVVMSVDITEVEVSTSVVTGTADENAAVQVWVNIGHEGPQPTRWVTAGPDGAWTADFANGGEGQGENGTWIFGPGTDLTAGRWDDDGDHSVDNWRIRAPGFGVNPFDDSVWGMDWEPGVQVTIEIDDGDPEVSPDFETTSTVDGEGRFGIGTRNDQGEGFDIQPGMLITVTQGPNTKTHTVTEVDITGVEQESDIVTGTAAPESTVQVWVDTDGGASPTRNVTATVDGVWTADFAHVGEGDWGGTWEIGPGTRFTAMQADEDGDHTVDNWYVRNTRIEASPRDNWIEGHEWVPGVEVLVNVDDPDGPGYVGAATPDWSGYVGLWDLEGYDLKQGQIITLTDGTTTRELVVSALEVTGFDIEEDTVSGKADPFGNVKVDVWLGEGDGRSRETWADENGDWGVDFTIAIGEDDGQQGLEFSKGTEGRARETDIDGDQTADDWHIPNPRIWADPQADAVGVDDFPPDTPVTITIDDLNVEGSPDVSKTVDSDSNGSVYLDDVGDVNGDCVVTANDGVNDRVLDVTNLAVTAVDIAENFISGTADPNTQLNLGFDGGYWGDPVQVGGDGTWMRDFDDITDPVIQIQPGQEGDVFQDETDGDRTQVRWRARAPRIEVSAVGDWLEGHDWIPGDPVLVRVENPFGSDFVETAYPDENGYIGLWDTGYNVQAGQTVTFSDGTTTKTHVVTSLTVDGFDAETDTVWGTVEPGTGGWIDVWNDFGTGRHIEPGPDGAWLVDFTKDVGFEDWMQGFNLVPGTKGRASQGDEDGDRTAVDWHILNPRFTASPAEDVVWGSDWTPNATMTVTIDASGTPAGVDATYTTLSGDNGDFGFGWPGPPMGGEVNAGDTITVTDGVTIKTHVVTALAITSFNRQTGAISGVAEPNSWFDGWYDGIGGGQGQADSDGQWTGDLSGGGTPLPYGASGGYEQVDDDSDSTIATWRVNWAETCTDPKHDTIEGNDWPSGAVVHITIEDPTTGTSPDYEATVTADEGFFGTQGLEDMIDIKAGMVVTVTDGDYLKEHVVTALTVDGVDADTDTVWGHADPFTDVWIRFWPQGTDNFEIQRTVETDGDGNWTVDLTDRVGPNSWDSGWDMIPGDNGSASQGDDDGDLTSVQWHASRPTFEVDPGLNEIEGREFLPSASVTVTVNSVFAATYSTDSDGAFGPAGLPVDLSVGDEVVVTDGTSTKSHIVKGIAVTGADAATEQVWGTTTDSDGWVVVTPDGDPSWRNVQAVSGEWTADFTGDYDIVPGDTGRAATPDDDDDATRVRWRAPTTPVAVDDDYLASEDDTLTVTAPGILGNDEYVADTLSIELVNDTLHGTLDLDTETGAFTYRPAQNYNGEDVFSYRIYDDWTASSVATVTITVTPVNDAPVAVDDTYGVVAGNERTVSAPGVLANDTDIDDDTLNVVEWSTPSTGTLSATSTAGAFTYTAPSGFDGTATFDYTVSDGKGGTDTATVTITVNAVNSAPVAETDAYETDEDVALVVDAADGVLENDSDFEGDELAAELVDDVENGTLALSADGSFTYTPNKDSNGTDSFTYKATDGDLDSDTATVTITVNAVNDAPVAVADAYATAHNTALVVPAPGVLGNDTDAESDTLTAVKVTDPAHGSVTLNPNGSFTYTPQTGYAGADTFTYKANDGTVDSAPVTVTITVGAAPAPAPVATALSLSSSSSRPVYGAAVTLSASLLGNGAGVAGQTVVFERQSGTSWVWVGSAVTGWNGVASVSVKPYGKAKTTYRARFDATATHLASISSSVVVTPKVHLTKGNAPKTMYRDKAKTVTGYLKPRHTKGSKKVEIKLYKRNSKGVYVYKSHVHATLANYSSYSKWTRSVKFSSKGKWRIRAYMPEDSKHAATYSSWDYVTVK